MKMRREIKSVMRDYDFATELVKLGAFVNYTNVNGTIVIHGVNYNSGEVTLKHAVFNELTGNNVTHAQLVEAVMSGDVSNPIYSAFTEFVMHPTNGYDEYLIILAEGKQP